MEEFISYTGDSLKLLVTLFTSIKIGNVSFGLASMCIGLIGFISYKIIRG